MDKMRDLDPPLTFHIYRDGEGRWRWVLNSRDGQSLAVCTESYGSEAECRRAISAVMRSTSAQVVSA